MTRKSTIRVGVPVMGKGATNHIHRPEIVEAFVNRGIELCFFVRPDYFDILDRFDGCQYVSCEVPEVKGFGKTIAGFFEYWRNLYPAKDTGRYIRRKELNSRRSCMARFRNEILAWGAGSKTIMKIALSVEELLLRNSVELEIHDDDLDCMLLLGIGTHGTQAESLFARWSRRKGLPVVQVVANYDGLSSKGFRGTKVGELLVWGPAMMEDAIQLQGIPESQVKMIGALRYDHLYNRDFPVCESFFSQIGLNSSKKTVLFAGGRNDYHYFEMLAAFEALKQNDEDLQLILRVYPKKGLLRSSSMRYLMRYARSMPDVYVSIGDPSFEDGSADREVLTVEEKELWPLIRYCDVVVNLYSTIALEACLFDKPVVNMWYFGNVGMTIQQPIYTPYPEIHHIRKFESYNAAVKATTREELMEQIQFAIQHPDSKAAQRRLAIEKELGPLDGKVKERLVDFCCSNISGIKSANHKQAA